MFPRERETSTNHSLIPDIVVHRGVGRSGRCRSSSRTRRVGPDCHSPKRGDGERRPRAKATGRRDHPPREAGGGGAACRWRPEGHPPRHPHQNKRERRGEDRGLRDAGGERKRMASIFVAIKDMEGGRVGRTRGWDLFCSGALAAPILRLATLSSPLSSAAARAWRTHTPHGRPVHKESAPGPPHAGDPGPAPRPWALWRALARG